MPLIRSVCVYCGSGSGHDPRFAAAAESFGQQLAEAGVQLVYGGGGRGLMGAVARSVLAHGGHVVGIIPDFLVSQERMLEEVQERIVVPDMHTRKRAMFERADAFVALPGGIGTLEELVEQLTWAQLGRHKKPVLIADLFRYWTPLIDMLAHMRNHGFVRTSLEVPYIVAESVNEILPSLEARAALTAAIGKEPRRSLSEEPLGRL